MSFLASPRFGLLCALITLLLYGLVIGQKRVASGDETISYLAATGNQERYEGVLFGAPPYGQVTSADEWRSFLQNGPGALSRVAPGLVGSDLHPPLYFWLLHFWSLLPVPLLASGMLFNCVLHLASLWVLGRLCDLCRLPPLGRGLCQLLWTLSPAIAGVGYQARQYELGGTLSLICAFSYLQNEERQSWTNTAVFWLSLFFSMMTMYLAAYFSAAYLGYELLIRRERRSALRTSILIGTAAIAMLLVHPGFPEQFARQQLLAQPYVFGKLLPRGVRILASAWQLLLPVPSRADVDRFSGPAAVTWAAGAASIGGLAGWLAFHWTLGTRPPTDSPEHLRFVRWMLLCSVLLSLVPFLLFRTPEHAFGGQYLVLCYPFLCLMLAGLLVSRPKLSTAAIGLMAMGTVCQDALFFQRQKSYAPLLAELSAASSIVVTEIGRQGFLRVLPNLTTQQVLLDKSADPCSGIGASGMFMADEASHKKVAESYRFQHSYPFDDGVTLWTSLPGKAGCP